MAYYQGDGVEQDLSTAANWLKLSSDQDKDTAQWLLGMMYESGHGVKQDSDRKSTRLNSSHGYISYAVFCLKQTYELQ